MNRPAIVAIVKSNGLVEMHMPEAPKGVLPDLETLSPEVKLTDEQAVALIEHAVAEGVRATKAYIEQHGENPLGCGFAWVNIRPARGQFVRLMKQMGAKDQRTGRPEGLGRSDSYEGGYKIWGGTFSFTQDMEAKEAGARAFAAVLRKVGVNCTVGTHLD